MSQRIGTALRRPAWMLAALLMAGTPAAALEAVTFDLRGGSEDLQQAVRDASGLLAAEAEGSENAQDLLVTARGEYARLLGALYALGHYSAVIEVQVDGREAAAIPPLDAPSRIDRIVVTVDPGPQFLFDRAAAAPLAQGTELPAGYAAGQPAQSGLIRDAAEAAVDGWRNVGHAKARVSGQDLIADHPKARLSADLTLAAGPRLRFGPLQVEGAERMDLRRLKRIAGLPEGETYDPEELEDAANRLRRSGVFRSVTLVEDETVTAPDILGITAQVVEEKTRRYSYGLEIASSEGAKISGYWLHRNLLRGGERLRVDAEIAQIGAKDSGADYVLGVTIDRPATLTRDTTATFRFRIGQENEADFDRNFGEIGLGFTQYVSDSLTYRAGIDFQYSQVTDAAGRTKFQTLGLPVGVNWDRRDSTTDAKRGFYVDAELRPFLGFGSTDSGLRSTVDARGYYSFGADDRITLAGRMQLGGVFGTSLQGTPRDLLFYSGGGGTVRGQPYQSLGVNVLEGGTLRTGGTTFAAISAEVRAKLTERIGVVGFVDAGFIGADGSGVSDSHAGAGLGLRYDTGFGPIRLDVAAPVSGDTGDGVQVYIGIGQAF
ncbi:autotransporter assembly complex protein TamA [Szabonella alba]|uniref:Outer membrane protein assembly factor n=1 Tax=Szabonella alba TaxID=2804194 RepID=A0A8K0V4K0_9RHOB|nr:autotransporter assembly complex family protein [Szabonella alba]MBL4915699.1 outer membrane protein assembly factor [Szabonella alba]